MEIVPYYKKDIQKLYPAFISAFSDYSVPMKLSFEDFKIRFEHKTHLVGDLSCMAMKDNKVLGFILHSRNDYNLQDTIYNAGTGIIPGERKKGIGLAMYQHLLKKIDNRLVLDF